MEKIVNMMEEAVVEQQLPLDEQQYWKNKILAHREFIRAHQDAVGRAMGSDATKLKKKLNALEKKNRRLAEFAVSMGIDPEDDKALKKTKKSGIDTNENVIEKLRTENNVLKIENVQQQQNIVTLTLEIQKQKKK
eukprot:296431_1